jgi:NAD(P) transhydrogenase subunit alpha
LDLGRLSGLPGLEDIDITSKQATITGHAAVLEGARQLRISYPMLTVDRSFVRPIRMAALGANAAGLQAIATARRLGSLTYGLGFEKDARQKIEKLGAKFLAAAEGSVLPSHALAELPAVELAALRRALADDLSKMQLIITSVVAADRSAPVLLDEKTLSGLKYGTVIIDLAAESGGNCVATRCDQVFDVSGVRIIGSTTLASVEATEASRLFGESLRKVLEQLVGHDGVLRLDRSNPIARALTGGEAITS